MTREKQLALSGVILSVLCRSLRVLMRLDKRVNAEFASLGDGFSFAVKIADGPGIGLKVSEDSLLPIAPDDGNIGLTIVFKDVTGAFSVLTGSTSVAAAFAQHCMQVYGSINQAMPVVRAIEIAEAYLLPKTVLQKSMPHAPRKNIPAFTVYAGLSFFRSKPAAVKKSGADIPAARALPRKPEISGDLKPDIESSERSVVNPEFSAKVEDLTDAS